MGVEVAVLSESEVEVAASLGCGIFVAGLVGAYELDGRRL